MSIDSMLKQIVLNEQKSRPDVTATITVEALSGNRFRVDTRYGCGDNLTIGEGKTLEEALGIALEISNERLNRRKAELRKKLDDAQQEFERISA